MNLFLLLLSTLFLPWTIQANEGDFKGWRQKHLDLISLFLPSNPTIFQVSNKNSSANPFSQIDLVRFSGDGLDVQLLNPEILRGAKVVHIDQVSLQYREWKNLIERAGFNLLSHWDDAGVNTAIFINRDFFYNAETISYLSSHFVDGSAYKKYFVPTFNIYYHLYRS